jgi:hypothetical protein
MLPETHRAALRAAAKIAFFSTVLGCGGSVDTGTNTSPAVGGKTPPQASSPSDDGPQQTDASVADSSASPDSAITPDAPPLLDAGVVPGIYTCREIVESAPWPDGGISWGGDAGVSAGTIACCQRLADFYDSQYSSGDGGLSAWGWGTDKDFKADCCAAIGYESTTCTPWGPPVPPAMPKKAARQLLVA